MSTLQRYANGADRAVRARAYLARVNDALGDAGSEKVAEYTRAARPKIGFGVGTAAGLVGGAIVGVKHDRPVLGALSGASLLTNGPALLRGDTRAEAFWNLAQTNAGVLLAWAGDTRKARALRFGLGWLAVGVARYFYEGGGQ